MHKNVAPVSPLRRTLLSMMETLNGPAAESDPDLKDLKELVTEWVKAVPHQKPATTLAPLRHAPLYIMETLNGPPEEIDPELKRLVTEWLKVKGDRPRFLEALLKSQQPSLREAAKAFTEYKVVWHVTTPADQPGVPYPLKGTQAEAYFLQFMLHPESWRLSGPCLRCRKYFLRETHHAAQFCSRNKCGKAATVSRSREKERQRKLDAINKAIEAWRKLKTKEDWRSYVAEQAGVTEKLLTRWANPDREKEPRITIPKKSSTERKTKTDGTLQTKGQ
jgi:hypothetical protein